MFLSVNLVLCCVTFSAGFLFESPSSYQHTDQRVHEFNFRLTWELSMTYTDSFGIDRNVSLDDDGTLSYTDDNLVKQLVNPKNLNTLDGFQTKYIAINGMYPGPTIEVPLGAEVYVHVTNDLLWDAATIHWHGLTMRGSQWFDGTPYITQCPILPHTSFTYRFTADEAGVFWYHSHMDMQRLDGLFGAIIVHDKKTPSLPGFTVQVNDWLHMDARSYVTTMYEEAPEPAMYQPIPDRYNDLYEEDVGDLPHDAVLVNGRGRYGNNSAPLTVHQVQSGNKYLFRFINTGYDNMYEVSIDSHRMKLVASDSCDVEPLMVDSVFLAVGERVTVEVSAEQPIGNYWVRYRSPHRKQLDLGFSILSYSNSNHSVSDPTTRAKQCTDMSPCVALNCPFTAEDNWICIAMSELRSTDRHAKEIDMYRSNDKVDEHFLAYSYMAGDTINGRAFYLPSSPFYQENYNNTGVPCDETVCNKEGCKCTNVLKLQPNYTVQLVVTHRIMKHFIHTWHMHGYRFAVLHVGYPNKDNVTKLISASDDIKCGSEFCYDARWTVNKEFKVDRPVIKDTVMIPNGGYVVVRFYTDNPGYWLGHCHQSEHLHEGMAVVLDVEGESIKRGIPKGFPTCGNFNYSP